MCLSVYGSQSLDDLEILVKEKFAAVPNSNLPPANIPSKNIKVQNIIKKVCSELQSLISVFGKTQLVKCALIVCAVCKPYLAEERAVQESCCWLQQPAVVFSWQHYQAAVISLGFNVTVRC